jgi:hypothetical protein
MPGRVFFEAANVTHEQSGPLTAGKVLRVVAHMRKLDVLSKAYEAYEGNFPLAVKNAYEKIINSEEGLDLEGKLAFDYIMNKNPPSKPNSVEMKTN